MSRAHKVLERHFRHWREKGLLRPEQEEQLRQASTELDRGRAGTIVRTALGVLGGGLLLAGLVLIVGENWAAIPRFAKLGAWAVLQCALLAAAHPLRDRFPDRLYLSDAFSLVAGGWVLGGIALVSQIYHLHAREADGLWLWLALVLPMAWALRTRGTAATVFAALTVALAVETGTDDSWIHAQSAEGPWLWLGIPLLSAVLVSFLRLPSGFIGLWVGTWVFWAANLFLLIFGATQQLDDNTLGFAWIVAGAAFVLALALPQRCLPAAWDPVTSRLFLVLSVLPWLLLGTDYQQGEMLDLTAVGLAWIAQLGLAVSSIRAGARAGAAVWINKGYVALLAGILTRYFDLFGEYLEGGAALVATGVLLLFVLYALEKARRRTLVQGVAA